MTGDDARRVAVRLPAAPDSISSARQVVRGTLADWDLEHLVDAAQLLTSEVTTNAVLHARTDFELRVELRDDVVRFTVCDRSGRAVARRHYGIEAGTGRGLGLVETMSVAWGTTDVDGWAKGVWFDLDLAGVAEADEGALYGEDWLALVDDL